MALELHFKIRSYTSKYFLYINTFNSNGAYMYLKNGTFSGSKTRQSWAKEDFGATLITHVVLILSYKSMNLWAPVCLCDKMVLYVLYSRMKDLE